MKQDNLSKTLAERGKRYGDFKAQAEISQNLKTVMSKSHNWTTLDNYQREALEMIQHKVARILNGDKNYDDSWRDIAGYATLVVSELSGEAK